MVANISLSRSVSKAFLLQHSVQNVRCKEPPTIPPIHEDSGDLLRLDNERIVWIRYGSTFKSCTYIIHFFVIKCSYHFKNKLSYNLTLNSVISVKTPKLKGRKGCATVGTFLFR